MHEPPCYFTASLYPFISGKTGIGKINVSVTYKPPAAVNWLSKTGISVIYGIVPTVPYNISSIWIVICKVIIPWIECAWYVLIGTYIGPFTETASRWRYCIKFNIITRIVSACTAYVCYPVIMCKCYRRLPLCFKHGIPEKWIIILSICHHCVKVCIGYYCSIFLTCRKHFPAPELIACPVRTSYWYAIFPYVRHAQSLPGYVRCYIPIWTTVELERVCERLGYYGKMAIFC